MKTDIEIKTEIRYWQGVLDGLKLVGKDKGDVTVNDAIVKAQASLDMLNWVLAVTDKS